MLCPLCGEDNSSVIDSRSGTGGSEIRRRRRCGSCSHRWTTYERISAKPLQPPTVVYCGDENEKRNFVVSFDVKSKARKEDILKAVVELN